MTVSYAHAYEKKYCKETIVKYQNKHLQKSEMPTIELRDFVFYCSDIGISIKHLDELDKDFIYMKALHNTREKFNNSYTETTPSIKYSDLIKKRK